MKPRNAHAALARFVAWDAVTSLGDGITETALLLRAGVSNVTRSRFVDEDGARIELCRANAVAPDIDGIERLEALARLALAGLSEKLPAPARRLFLAVPERFARIGERLSGALDIEVFPFGRAGGALALSRAIACLDAEEVVLWGGVDSLHDWAALDALAQADRLLTNENLDGVRPGEGAAFVALTRDGARDGIGVVGIGLGREPSPLGSARPSRAQGLSCALDAALAPLRANGARSNAWMFDHTHEDYATRELQHVIGRFGDVFGTATELETPLKELGDAGAAALPLLAALGAEAWRLGFAADRTAVLACGSDDGARGALLLASDGVAST